MKKLYQFFRDNIFFIDNILLIFIPISQTPLVDIKNTGSIRGEDFAVLSFYFSGGYSGA
jgi:hypothetical protein